MPKVQSRVKSTRGAERSCGRCGHIIQPGERYFTWSFRYGGSHFACKNHPPRPSELTQSLMTDVYAAIERAEDELPGAATIEDVRSCVEEVAGAAEEVAQAYRDAAEQFGGAGENADRADELEGWVGELQNFSPEEPEDNSGDLKERIETQMRTDGFSEEDENEWISVLEARLLDAQLANDDGAIAEAIENARGQADEILGTCPL